MVVQTDETTMGALNRTAGKNQTTHELSVFSTFSGKDFVFRVAKLEPQGKLA